MAGLLPKEAFVGIEHVAHLGAGGEAPVLRSHLQAATRFLLDKGAGMPGRDRFFTVTARARASVARLLGGRPEDVAFLGNASEGLFVASQGVAWRPGTICYANGQGERYLRLAYSALDLDELREAARRLGQAIREAM